MPADTAQNYHIEGLPFGTRGGMLIPYQFPADGEYSFKVKGVTGYFQAVLGGVKGEQLEVTIDGERVKLFDWDKEIANTTGNGRSTPRVPVKAGLHTVGVTFLATNDMPGSELNRPFQRTMNTPGSIPGFQFYPHVGQVWIEGPFNAKGATDTASRRQDLRLPSVQTPREDDACARRIVIDARQARVPPSGDAGRREDADGVLPGGPQRRRHVRRRHRSGAAAHPGRPEFIYRGEREPAGVAAGKSVSHQRSRARLAPVVLPLEQHSGRRADRRRRAGPAQGPGGAREAGAADARGSEVAGARHATSPASG